MYLRWLYLRDKASDETAPMITILANDANNSSGLESRRLELYWASSGKMTQKILFAVL